MISDDAKLYAVGTYQKSSWRQSPSVVTDHRPWAVGQNGLRGRTWLLRFILKGESSSELKDVEEVC